MAKYRYATSRRRINYKGISAIVVIVAGIGLTAMTARSYFITKNIKNVEASIEQLENDKIKLKDELDGLEDATSDLEKKAEAMKEVLWRYEPVIIPDSMK